MFLSAPWRLSLLFLVSGAATAFLLQHRGAAGFLGGRSWRLLVPLVFGMLVVVPPQAYHELLESGYPGGYHQGYFAFWLRYLAGDDSFCDDDGCLDLPPWNHLWFVAYLWVYTLVLWALLRAIIVVASRALRPLDLHPALEGPLLVALTFALAFAGYEIVRHIALLRPLFGLKRWRRPAPAPLPDAPRSAG